MKVRKIKHNRGKREAHFESGRRVYIRDYRNPNKPSWAPAVIKEKKGSRHYDCVISQTSRIIKRHLNQIRDATVDSGRENSQQNELQNQSAPVSEAQQTIPEAVDVDAENQNEGDDEDLERTLTSNTMTSEYLPSSPDCPSSPDSVIENVSSPYRNRSQRNSAQTARGKITNHYTSHLG